MNEFDPDSLRKDDPAYWASALVFAIRNGNIRHENAARTSLRRLGFDLVRASRSIQNYGQKSTATNPGPTVEANFRRLLATGQPVALEDATKGITVPEGFDLRTLGSIPQKMQRDGEIVEAGFRRAKVSRCNSGIKRLWVLAKA